MVPKLSGSTYPHACTIFPSHPCKIQDRRTVKGFSFVSSLWCSQLPARLKPIIWKPLKKSLQTPPPQIILCSDSTILSLANKNRGYWKELSGSKNDWSYLLKCLVILKISLTISPCLEVLTCLLNLTF